MGLQQTKLLFGVLAGFVLLQLASVAQAAPNIVVKSRATGTGNTSWKVFVSPDPALFSPLGGRTGGSLAVEIGFKVTNTTFVRGTLNSMPWIYKNPGLNPHTNSVTTGVYFAGVNAVFAEGNAVFIIGSPLKLIAL